MQAIGHTPDHRALIVFDTQSELARLLTDAYRAVLPEATFVDFDQTTPDDIRAMMDTYAPRDLVVLIQSGSFRLNEFRFRLELFNRSLAVIEHPHLGRILGEEMVTYVDSIAYDPSYYRTVGPALKQRIDAAQRIEVIGEHTHLTYEAPFESAKLNIGDYTGMKNIGGQFPIGEVFTEPADLTRVNGTVALHAYGGVDFRVRLPEIPIVLTIESGKIVAAEHATEDFQQILDEIREEEGLWVRELGFGMNRAMTKTRTVIDVGSYERMCGIHLSMGAKHTIYTKAGFPKRSSHYHVDVFADTKEVRIDDDVVYKDGAWCV